MSQYGDISPRTAGYAAAQMLDRAMPAMCMARFGQQVPIPKNKSMSVKLRRYNSFAPSLTPLVEGVTPQADQMSSTDVNATLQQYGRRTTLTDIIIDTHEDNVLQEYSGIMGELAGQTMELVVFAAIRAGTNVMYGGGTSRATVNAPVSKDVLDRAIRQLKRQNAVFISQMLTATDKVGTSAIRPAFVAFCHPDLENDLEAIDGYKTVANYSVYKVLTESEIGSYRNIRFMTSTLYAPYFAAGSNTYAPALMSNGGAGVTGTDKCDVYPLIICGKNSYGTVSLQGASSLTPMVVNPKPSDSDPMGQRGHIAFKFMATAVILNDAWMVRVECAVKA